MLNDLDCKADQVAELQESASTLLSLELLDNIGQSEAFLPSLRRLVSAGILGILYSLRSAASDLFWIDEIVHDRACEGEHLLAPGRQ